MYECRCPRDGKKLAHIARPPLWGLRCVELCPCGRRVTGRVLIEKGTNRIVGEIQCPCGRSTRKLLGYLVAVKCRRCKGIIRF